MAKANVTITDYSAENSSFGYSASEFTSGNIVAQTALHDALRAATVNITIGHVSKQTVSEVLLDAYDIPGSVYAQREMKWLVTYVGNTAGKKFQTEVAAPDLTGNIIPGSDIADITSTDWAAWVTAFEAVAKSPDDLTETVTVTGARLVGRNI